MRTWISCAMLLLAFPAAGQNLIDDGSFENGAVAGCSLGLVPDTWIRVLGTPDTFSEDCQQSPGASRSFPPGHFANLTGGAFDGIRFVALSNDPVQPDGIGQRLATPLQPAQSYQIRAEVARSEVSTGIGPVDVYLSATASFDGATYLATLAVSPVIRAWREGVATFCAPLDADVRPYLLIRPRVGVSSAYLATDAWELTPGGPECPPPPEIIPGPGASSLALLALLLIGLGLSARSKTARGRGSSG